MDADEQDQILISLRSLVFHHDDDDYEVEPKITPTETESVSESLPSLEDVEEIIGYEFNDKSLLEQAFTHGSYLKENKSTTTASYERLEYIGDSVLNLLIAKEQYFLYPDLAPGSLTKLRAANVNTEKLARVAVHHGLYKYLRHRKPLLAEQIGELTSAILDYPVHSTGLIKVPKVLADIVESTVGAIFIDSNSSLNITWQVVKKLLQPIITPAELDQHPMTRLYELCQKNGLRVHMVDDLWEKTGEIEVYVNNEFVGRSSYKNKKLIAQYRAAYNATGELLKKLAAKAQCQ